MRTILLLTDKKGWHYKQLIQSIKKYNIDVITKNLSDLSISIINNEPQILQKNGEPLNVTDVFVRHIPGGSLEEIITYLNILKTFQLKNINVMNTAENIEMTVDKSLTSLKLKDAGILTPNTWIIHGKNDCKKAINKLTAKHPLIYKPLFGSQGDNIIKITSPLDFDLITNTSNIYYLQEFLETEPSHDYRVLIIQNKYKKIFHTMMRYGDNFLNNISKGAKCVPVKIDHEIINTAIEASNIIDIPFCGVDIIKHNNKNYVIELNSIPAWKGMQSITDASISDQITEIFLSRDNDIIKSSIKK